MIVLGIESTAHTFGVSIVNNGRILSNEKSLYTTEKGGFVPSKVADYHVENAPLVLKKALVKANVSINDVDIIGFSNSPGIGHSLRIGALVARLIALKTGKPLVPVNHCIAHLEIGRHLSGFKDPLLLYASGANTQIIAFEAGRYRVFGETLDVGIGNFLDTFAREYGLGFPGGPRIMDYASKGENYVELPYIVKGMDISLGGMLTKLKSLKNKYSVEDLCYSVQETVFSMLVEVTERALAHTGKKQVVLGGGVGCNTRLQEMLRLMCEERGVDFFVPSNEFLVDNAAMIALTASYKYDGVSSDVSVAGRFDPYLRTDEVEINYR